MFLRIDSYVDVKAETGQDAKLLARKKALSFMRDASSDNLFRKYAATNEATPKDLMVKLKVDYEAVDDKLLFVKRNKFLFCKRLITKQWKII